MAAAAHGADRARRVADDQVKVGHVAGDDAAHADHREAADAQVAADRAAGADRRACGDQRRRVSSSGSEARSSREVGRRRPGKDVVGEDRAGADHHAVFDRHAVQM